MNRRLRKVLSRSIVTVAASSLLAVAVPGNANAACAPSFDAIPYAAEYVAGNLNTVTGQLDWTWQGEAWGVASGCVGTLRIFIRISDRSIVPAGALYTTNWQQVAVESNPDGGYYGYRGGARTLVVTYRDSFTGPMRGLVGQVTVEAKAEFTDTTNVKTSFCEGATKTFTATPNGPAFHSGAVYEPCTL